MAEKQQTRSRPDRSTPKTRTTRGNAGRASETSDPGVELAGRSLEASMQGLAAVAGGGDGNLILGDVASTQVGQSDITDELTKGGPAFGSFVDNIGQAVARAQTSLDTTLVATAESLSKTEINVIAVYEQVLSDADGTMDRGNAVMQKLPLINYLMPTAYQWSRVFLEADMSVSEFNSANGFNIQSRSSAFGASASARYGFGGGFGVSGGVSYGSSSYGASGGASYAQDYAAGKLHLEATLEPRADVQTPKPLILQKGPTLQVTLASRNELDLQNEVTLDPTLAVARRIILVATLLKIDGTANTSKTLAVAIDQPSLDYVTAPTNSKTNEAGQLTVTITRHGTAQELSSAVQANLNIRFGLITKPVSISI